MADQNSGHLSPQAGSSNERMEDYYEDFEDFPSGIDEEAELAIRILDEISPSKSTGAEDFDRQLEIGAKDVLDRIKKGGDDVLNRNMDNERFFAAMDAVRRAEAAERMNDDDFRRIQEGANMVVTSLEAERRSLYGDDDEDEPTNEEENIYRGLDQNVASVIDTLNAEDSSIVDEELRRGAQAVIDEINRLHEQEGISYADLYEGLDENVAAVIDALEAETAVLPGSPSRFSAFGSPKSPEKYQESKKVYAQVEAQYEEIITKIRASPTKEYGADVGLLEGDQDLDRTKDSFSSPRGSPQTPEKGGKGDQEDIARITIKAVMDNAKQKEHLEKTEKEDCERMMDSYKKLVNGSQQDQERLEREQQNFVESLIHEGRRRYLLLLAFKFSEIMNIREAAGDETDYTSLLKLFVAGYFYPERFRRRKINSEGQRFGAEWLKQVDTLMEHAMEANPEMTKQEAFLGSVNEAWERTKKHQKEVIQEIAEETIRAEDDELEEKERWGERWLRQVDILIAATLLNSKIPVTGKRVHLIANKPMDLDKTYVMDVRTVVEWDQFQDIDWKNLDEEESTALYTTGMEILEERFNENWRSNVKLAVEYLDNNHGLEYLEKVLKMMSYIAADDVKKFDPDLAAMIVFVHRYIQKERGQDLPDLITDADQLLNVSLEEDTIQRLVQDHQDLSTESIKGAHGIPAVEALLQHAHEDGENYYLEMLMMSMAWPEELNMNNKYVYSTMMRIHDYILLK